MFGEMLVETVSLLCAMAIYGPPVVFLVAPLLFLALLLAGPFAVVVTMVAAVLAAAALLVAIAALLATPFLVVRRHAALARPAATRMPIELRRVAA
jgi:hypothetical protein